MKYLIIFLVLCSFFSCDLGDMLQDHYEADIEGFMVDNGIDTRDKILRWVADNIDYKRDNPEEFFKIDDWQTPEETFYKRTGDCEDFVILAMYMLNKIGIKSQLIALCNRKEPLRLHAILYIDNYYSPQTSYLYDISEWYILITYTLSECLDIAENSAYRNIVIVQ